MNSDEAVTLGNLINHLQARGVAPGPSRTPGVHRSGRLGELTVSRRKLEAAEPGLEPEYTGLLGGIADLMEQARRRAAGAVNSILTATYWEIGRQIVEFEQCGKPRAEYGQALLKRLAANLTVRSGRGFSKSNLFQMRAFYQGWPILQTPSGTFLTLPDCRY